MENAFEPASSDSVEGKIPEGVRLPNLDDPLVIKDLLRAHAMAVSKRLAEAVHKNVRREESRCILGYNALRPKSGLCKGGSKYA